VALDERQLERAHRDARRIGSMLRERTAQLLRAGHDPMPMLAAVQRELKQAQELPRPERPSRE
jgi:hypothetical protein